MPPGEEHHLSDFPIQSSQYLDAMMRAPEFIQALGDIVACESKTLGEIMRNAVHNGDQIEAMRLEAMISEVEELPALLQKYAALYQAARE